MQSQGTIQNLLQKTLASSVGASASQIHTAKASTRVPQAFKTIYDYKLHSLPVQTDNGEEFVSFVDLADITSHLFSSFTDEELKHANLPQITEYKGEYIRVVGEKDNMWEPQEIPDPSKIQHFANKSVGLIAKTPYIAVSDKKTLWEVLQTMVSSKARRVALHGDQPQQLTKIVTHSDIIRFLDQQDLGNAANVTVKDLGLETKDVVKVKTTDVAIEGFKLMNNNNISGVAVVDENDNFVGNLSLSDLRLIVANANELLHLYLNVGEYIKKSGKVKGISCTKDTSLKEVIHTFVTNKIQRIFVIDNDNKVTGLVSMTDVINIIYSSKL